MVRAEIDRARFPSQIAEGGFIHKTSTPPLPGVLMKTLQGEMLADQKHTGKGEGRNLMDSLLEFHTFGHESIPKKASYVEVTNSMTR